MKIDEKTFKAMPADLQALFRKCPNPGSAEVLDLFPVTKSGKDRNPAKTSSSGFTGHGIRNEDVNYGDTGSAARFFKCCPPDKLCVLYAMRNSIPTGATENAPAQPRLRYCSKASKADRNEGCESAKDTVLARSCQAAADAKRGKLVECAGGAFNKARIVKNNHPTVKPTALMRYLCRLVTPPGGIVLDPFMGSGSTGKAAVLEGFRFIGIDIDKDYCKIAVLRIRHIIKGKNEVSV